jgi:hypothetical protein
MDWEKTKSFFQENAVSMASGVVALIALIATTYSQVIDRSYNDMAIKTTFEFVYGYTYFHRQHREHRVGSSRDYGGGI